MATYSTDLQTITLCDSGTFTEFTGYTTGGAPALSAENYIHNSSSVDQATGQAIGQQASIAFDYGSNIAWTAGWVVMAWQYFAAPTAIDSWANGGMRVGIGASLANVSYYNAVGNNFGDYPYGGWQNTAIDPQLTADQTVGTGSGGNYRYFGSMTNQLAKITKGSPHGIDAYRFGRGQIKVIGTGANFDGLAAANDATTARWGLFSKRGTAYRWKGLVSRGDASNSVAFSDSNKAINLEDAPRVSATFNRFELRNAASVETWTGITINGVQTSITGSAPVSRGDFEVFDGAQENHLACTFNDLGTFKYNSNSTIDSTTYRRCNQISPLGAGGTGALFESSNDSSGALLVASASEMSALHACQFRTNAKAIKITTAGVYTFDGHQFSGNTVQVDFTGTGTCEINPTNGCNVSQAACTASGGGTITVNAVQVQFSFQLSPAITGYEWRLYVEDPAAGIFGGTALAGEETATTSSQSYSYVTGNAGTDVVLQIIADGYMESVTYYTLTTTGSAYTINLQPEENA